MENGTLSAEVIQSITADQAWHYQVVPCAKREGVLELLSVQSSDAISNELALVLGTRVSLINSDASEIQRLLNTYYRKSSRDSITDSVQTVSNEQYLLKLLHEGRSLGASDIHIEIYQDYCRIRLRIDGMLIERYRINKSEHPALVNKIKIKAGLDISEKRLPQDGRINVEDRAGKFDVRVSILPTLYGEKIVMRYLGNDSSKINLQTLGLSEEQIAQYLTAIKKPNGIILISGPTGSGKTTTLYGTLRLLNEEKRNIVTAEDPVEYTLEGINQVQLKESIGLTFASALRTFLRQDPDVIMIGEIRDQETAEMAIRASLTGHLVLSTIHTNSAWGTVERLVDMGVPSFLLASTLSMSVAQRLVRKLCPHCKKEDRVLPQAARNFKLAQSIHFVATGCEQCFYTGYKGRIGIYEMISIDSELAECIKTKAAAKQIIESKGIRSLAEQGLELVKQGETSFEEIYPLLLESE